MEMDGLCEVNTCWHSRVILSGTVDVAWREVVGASQ